MSALHEAARRVVAAWAGLRPTRPSWINDVNAAVLSLGEALKAQPEPKPEQPENGLRTAAQLALEALEYGQHSLKQVSEHQWESRGQLAMDALKAALAQPEPAQEPITRIFGTLPVHDAQQAEPAQEPVAWMFVDDTGMRFVSVERPHKDFQPLYTAPQPQQPEPAACIRTWHKNGEQHAELRGWEDGIEGLPDGEHLLYTAPLQRPPLTDEEIDRLWHDNGAGIDAERFSRIARAIERKLRGEA